MKVIVAIAVTCSALSASAGLLHTTHDAAGAAPGSATAVRLEAFRCALVMVPRDRLAEARTADGLPVVRRGHIGTSGIALGDYPAHLRSRSATSSSMVSTGPLRFTKSGTGSSIGTGGPDEADGSGTPPREDLWSGDDRVEWSGPSDGGRGTGGSGAEGSSGDQTEGTGTTADDRVEWTGRTVVSSGTTGNPPTSFSEDGDDDYLSDYLLDEDDGYRFAEDPPAAVAVSVPEPSSLALCAIGLVGLFRRRSGR